MQKKKNVNNKNHKEKIPMKIDRAVSSAIIVSKKLFP